MHTLVQPEKNRLEIDVTHFFWLVIRFPIAFIYD